MTGALEFAGLIMSATGMVGWIAHLSNRLHHLEEPDPTVHASLVRVIPAVYDQDRETR